jgi:hypothetical protein
MLFQHLAEGTVRCLPHAQGLGNRRLDQESTRDGAKGTKETPSGKAEPVSLDEVAGSIAI